MLRHQLIHPKINEVLGRAGHHAKILIADGNYPASSAIGPNAELVSLNLMPGVVTCTQVLEALLSAIPIEAANTMMYETTGPYACTKIRRSGRVSQDDQGRRARTGTANRSKNGSSTRPSPPPTMC